MALLLLSLLFSPAVGQLHDPLVVGKTFMAGSTDPTAGSTAWALTSHGISEKLFTVDETGNIVPQVGQSVSKVDTFTWDVALTPGYKFSDGTDVTAQHVADALTELNQQNSGAQASLGTMTVTAPDASTVRIVSERATPVMDAVLAEWPFVVYLNKGGQRYFTGPYKVETFVSGDHIDLVPNTHYARALVTRWHFGKLFNVPLWFLQRYLFKQTFTPTQGEAAAEDPAVLHRLGRG